MSRIDVELLVADVGEQEVQVDETTTLSEIIDYFLESYSTFQGVPKQNIKLKAQQSGVYLNNLNMTAQDALQLINNQVIVVEKNANENQLLNIFSTNSFVNNNQQIFLSQESTKSQDTKDINQLYQEQKEEISQLKTLCKNQQNQLETLEIKLQQTIINQETQKLEILQLKQTIGLLQGQQK